MSLATDRHGRVTEFKTQFIPELSARREGKAVLEPGGLDAAMNAWTEAADRFLDRVGSDKVRYAKRFDYDTKVFGKEETRYPSRPAQTSLVEELGRRRAILK